MLKVVSNAEQSINYLQENLDPNSPKKITLALSEGVVFIELDKTLHQKSIGFLYVFYLIKFRINFGNKAICRI